MPSANVYNVTEWPFGDPNEDIGAVINSIIADIKRGRRSPMSTTAASPVP